MQELIYTSSGRGLKTGASGFCSVAWTRGISVNLIEPLENLSVYKPLYFPGDERCDRNPVSFGYRRIRYGSLRFPVVSRIAYAGLDDTARSNKIAHHIVPEEEDQLQNTFFGPAGLLLAPENFCTAWHGEPKLLEGRKLKVPPPPLDTVARTWAKYKGDAGFAGIAARRTAELLQLQSADPGAALYLAYPPEMPSPDVLRMIFEVLLLLKRPQRLQCTFNTYFIQPQIGVECLLRAVPEGNPHLNTMRHLAPNRVIDLTGKSAFPAADGDPYVQAARSGTVPEMQEDGSVRPEIRLELEPQMQKTINLSLPKRDEPVPVPQRTMPDKTTREPSEAPADHPFRAWLLGIAVLLFLLIFAGAVHLHISGRKTVPGKTPAVAAPAAASFRKDATAQSSDTALRTDRPKGVPESAGAVLESRIGKKTVNPVGRDSENEPDRKEDMPKTASPAKDAVPLPAVPAAIPQAPPEGSVVPLKPAVEKLTFRISENFVPDLAGKREKTPQECELLQKYAEELGILRSDIIAWNEKRNRWFQVKVSEKKAAENWEAALRNCKRKEQDILSSKDFREGLKKRLKTIDTAEDKEEKAALAKETKDWILFHFPLLAAKEKAWEKDFDFMEGECYPKSRKNKTEYIRPDWLQAVYEDAKEKSCQLYLLYQKKTEAERKEKKARTVLQKAGKALLRSPLVGTCGLTPDMKKCVEERKSVNLQNTRKRVEESLSRRMMQELQKKK